MNHLRDRGRAELALAAVGIGAAGTLAPAAIDAARKPGTADRTRPRTRQRPAMNG